MDLAPDHIRAKKSLLPPLPSQRGCKRKPKGGDGYEPFQARKGAIFCCGMDRYSIGIMGYL